MSSHNNIFPGITPPAPGAVLLEIYEYGEGQPDDKAKNLRGRLYAHYDASGRQSNPEGYDFKGNAIEPAVQLLADATATDFNWDGADDTVLNDETFTTTTVYDALNRPLRVTDPGGNITRHTFDRGGMLNGVYLTPAGGTEQTYVSDIRYDAKRQRAAIYYGNGTTTGYTYDEFTFRLRRLLTTGDTGATKYQDLNYYYDPVGNITTIRDDVQPNIFYNNTVIEAAQSFTYDALYRLTAATGRELINSVPAFGAQDNWWDAMAPNQPGSNAAQNYTQQYTYDAAGNILTLQHTAGSSGYTRSYNIDAGSNRLLGTTVGSNTYSYTHDARGNMLTMPHLQNMGWNALNELYTITQGTTVANYQYSGGQRIRKYVDKGSIKEERIYLGSYELYRKFDNTGSLTIERTTVHVSDDTGRIAMLETRTQGNAADDNNTAGTLTRYIYSNHLQSASLELNESAEIISYEEYHPYGTTAYQAVSAAINAVAKRYRYTGKERDEESGLYYHGARYYIPWLARWSACDPLESKYTPWSCYNYGNCNPVIYIDPSGMGGEDVIYEGETSPAVEITPEEGRRKVEVEWKTSIDPDGVSAGMYIPHVSYFHRGGDSNASGWYSEEQYMSMTREVMTGIIHALGQKATGRAAGALSLGSGMFGGREAWQQADVAASKFLQYNDGAISEDFFSLLSREASGIIKDFRWKYGGTQTGVVYLTDSPIDYVAGGILEGLAKAASVGASLLGSEIKGGIESMNALSMSYMRQYAVAGLEEMVSASIEKSGISLVDDAAKTSFKSFNSLNDLGSLFKNRSLTNASEDLMKSGWKQLEGNWGNRTVFEKQIGNQRYYAQWEVNAVHSTTNQPVGYWKLTYGKINATTKNTIRVSPSPNFKP